MSIPNTTELALRIAVAATGSAINYVESAHPVLIQKIQSEIDSFMNPKLDIEAIMAEIRANNSKLEACLKPHIFERDPSKPLGKRTCKKCGGKIDAIHAIWYERGLTDKK